MTKTILVTGGAGFIGSHLCDGLLERGYSVRVIDDFSTGKMGNLPANHPQLLVIKGDIQDHAALDAAVQGCSGVVHLAAVASVQASVDNPVATHGANFIGTLNLLESCRCHGVKRIIYASSAAVYGDTEILPVSEAIPPRPLTPYAADKLAGEQYLDFYRRQHGLEPGIFRFFNIFGPRQDPSSPYSGVISIFTDRSRAGQGLTVFGDGGQTRDFVYVADLIEILIQALECDALLPGPVNVGNGQQTSLNQLISELSLLCARDIPVQYLAARKGDIKHSRADNSRLRARFNFQPQTTFGQGLRILMQTG